MFCTSPVYGCVENIKYILFVFLNSAIANVSLFEKHTADMFSNRSGNISSYSATSPCRVGTAPASKERENESFVEKAVSSFECLCFTYSV